MRAADFDGVAVDGDGVTSTNHFGLRTIRLDLRVVDDPDALLSYEQVDGIFEAMETRDYLVAEPDATTVTAVTISALGAGFVGPLLDATVILRQRRPLHSLLSPDLADSHPNTYRSGSYCRSPGGSLPCLIHGFTWF